MTHEHGAEKCAIVVSVAVFLLLTSLPVLALDEAARRTLGESSVKAGPVIAIAIAYFSRRQAIGSWLLCYYVQLYSAIVLTTWLFAMSYQHLMPSTWDSALRYVMFLFSVIPLQIARVVELILGTRLLLQRTQERLRDLRWVQVAMLVASSVAVGIDAYFFPVAQEVFVHALALGFSIAWLAYFYRARRVRLVFIEGKWAYEADATKRVLTSEDRRRLGRRTLIASTVTFVVLLVLMGLSLGDKKPHVEIFFVPLLYAAIAALIAWYLPLRKRGAEQASSEPKITAATSGFVNTIRGLFRVGVVLTAAWAVLISVAYFLALSEWVSGLAGLFPFSSFDWEPGNPFIVRNLKPTFDMLGFLETLVIPPLLLWVIGGFLIFAARWVYAGFTGRGDR